jgi:2-polyprenyl-3-methyl-5-hydroxy-6-metoxy-1,4-benzoquinol methylase
MIKCIKCGSNSKHDICNKCLNGMKDLNQRKKLYNLRYSKYLTDHGKVEVNYLDKYLKPNQKILEIGCGAGHLSNYLFKKKLKVSSIDFSQHMVDISKKNYPHLNPKVMNAEKLSFKDNSFDVVISYELIEHLFDVKSHLSEVNRILKKGGLYIIKTPNKIVDSLYFKFTGKDDKYRNSFHPSLQSHKSLKKILHKNGFSTNYIKIRKLSKTQIKKLKYRIIIFSAQILIKILPKILLPTIIGIAKKNKIKK